MNILNPSQLSVKQLKTYNIQTRGYFHSKVVILALQGITLRNIWLNHSLDDIVAGYSIYDSLIGYTQGKYSIKFNSEDHLGYVSDKVVQVDEIPRPLHIRLLNYTLNVGRVTKLATEEEIAQIVGAYNLGYL